MVLFGLCLSFNVAHIRTVLRLGRENFFEQRRTSIGAILWVAFPAIESWQIPNSSVRSETETEIENAGRPARDRLTKKPRDRRKQDSD